MKQYIDALKYIMKNGEDVNDRTGTGTKTVFGYQMRFDLQEGFPAVTTKKLAWKSVVSELLWFLEGSTDERRLAEILYNDERQNLTDKTTIWTANADKQGKALGHRNDKDMKELGPVYGSQWRNFGGVDQILEIVDEIKTNPDSRRIIMSSWNPPQLKSMALPPCHTLAQFRVINGKLSCQLYQRSADMFLGVPFNIASYALLTHMIAGVCGLEVGELVWTGGDCHIYNNHIDAVKKQVKRKPRKMPTLEMPVATNMDRYTEMTVADFVLVDYDPMDSISAPMAV